MLAKSKNIRKVLSIFLIMLTIFSIVHPIFAASGTAKFVGGQYDSGMKTTDNQNTSKGVMIRRLINSTTGDKMTTFCAEYSVDFKSGTTYTGQYYKPVDENVKRACKVAYFGWYSKYPDYYIDGGILAADMIWVREAYVFTQQYIWQTLGQTNAQFIDAEVQSRYVAFQNEVNAKIASMETRPSFCNSPITVDIGKTTTLTDTNGVLADYSSIDITTEGIRIVHNKGENTMNITVNNDCTKESYVISDLMMLNWGCIKEASRDYDTTLFFEFKSGVQNQLYAMNYNDPVPMSLMLNINLFGNIELSKLDKDGKLIDGAVFEVKGPDNYSKDVTVTGGKITLSNLKRGTYTVKEKSAPNGYLLNNNTYTVEVVPNQTATQAIINEKPTGTFTLVKKNVAGTVMLEGTKYRVWNNKGYDKEFTTNANGEIIITGLELGKYNYKEIQATNGYLLDTNTYTFELKYKDQNTSIVYANAERTNKEPTGTFTLIKKNEDGSKKVAGVKYRVWSEDESYNQIHTTSSTGEIKIEGLKMGKYYYQETQAVAPYLIDNTKYSFELKYKDQNTSVIYASTEKINNEPRGTFTLVKKNSDGSATLEGTKYRIWNDSGYDKEFTTDKNGKIEVTGLRLGNYNYKEIQASNGYLLDTNTYSFDITYKDQNTSIIYANAERTNIEPTGTITIVKKDSETGSTPQGDAELLNAKYEVYANEDIYNKARTKKFYSKGDLVATRTMNEEGITEDVTNLPLGKYIVKEAVASKGYLLDLKEYEINLQYKDQNTSIITESTTSYEVVKKMQVHIFKSGIKENSGLLQGLEGAEFTIKLNSDVENAYSLGYSYAEVWNGIDEYGNNVSVNKTRVQEAQKIAPTYEAIITDKDGNAYTQTKLPFGKYIVKETVTPKDFESAADFTFSITEDESEIEEVAKKVKHLVVNNEQLETYIKLIKKDLTTDKTVTLNSSTFQIKATKDIYDRGTGKILYKKGEIIKQKVGNTTYYAFTTNADNIVVPEGSYNSENDDKGSVVTPLLLPVGSYEITEIRVPTGFLQLENPITFKIEGLRDYDKDQDGDFIKEVIIKNEQPTGSLILTKTIALREDVNTSLKDISDLSGIQFKLIAREDVIDYADGSIIYKKGQEVNTYNLDKEGNLKVDQIPMGSYQLQEIKTLDGLVLDNSLYDIDFIKKDLITKVYEQNVDIVNETTLVEISKQGITGEKELVGAKLTVIDENAETIDEWTSTEITHKIEGLVAGKTYTLREEIAPDGYVRATEIQFTVENTAEIQKVQMIDKVVEMTKTDIGGMEIEGAKIQVFDKENNLMDEWSSTKEPHRIRNLVEGEIYILHEEIAPDGFVKATDIEFTVTYDKDIQQITMIDKIVEMSKQDIGGQEVEGAKIIVYDKEKNVIDEWTSTKESHKIKNLVEGETYILHEEIAPDGYVIATDVEFTVGLEKENQTIEMIDKTVEMSKVDIAGEEIEGAEIKVFDEEGNTIDEWTSTKEPHKIKNLIEGKKYILHEEYAPNGYVIATDVEFIVGLEKETQKIEMIDKIVEISKKDIAGEELEGATLVVTNTRTKNIVDKWVSGKEPHKIQGLIEGETYILHEEIAIDGYVKASSIEFTVSPDKETQKIDMVDKVVLVSKTDLVTGEELPGAKLQITDKDGNIIDEWISTDEPHPVTGLEEGQEYTLIEITSPYGYEIAESITFKVTNEKETQKIEMKDKPILQNIKVVKLDSDTNEKIKSNFKFAIYEDGDCTKLIEEIEANAEEGTVEFKDLRYGTYFIKETKAPMGYYLSEKIVKIEINENGVFADGEKLEEKDEAYSFNFYDTLIPTIQTGTEVDNIVLISLMIISLIGITLGIIAIKRKNK